MYKNVVILGAGKDGKQTAKTLLNEGISVRCFIDDNKVGNEYSGIKVINPISYVEQENECCILCIGELCNFSDAKIIQSQFIKKISINENNFFVLDRAQSIYNSFVDNLVKNNIDYQNNILNIKGYLIPNFLLYEEHIKRTFLLECCDLILPAMFNDNSVIDEGPYEYENVTPFSAEDDTRYIIDCGANLGIFSAYAAKDSNNIVYAFEPIKQSRDILEKTASLYNNILVNEEALSDYIGTVTMTESDNLGQNKIINDGSSINNTTSVACTTLDEFVRYNNLPRVDFIKADIEGAERNMLLGARAILRQYGPQLAICTYHLDDDPIVLEKIIKEANPRYVVKHAYKKLYAYIR